MTPLDSAKVCTSVVILEPAGKVLYATMSSDHVIPLVRESSREDEGGREGK